MGLQLRVAYLPIQMTRPAQGRVMDFGGAEVHETPDKPESPFRPLPSAGLDMDHLLSSVVHGKSQAMKLTAPIAIPTPKTIPARVFLDWPSP
jgi:hypothetical protein